MIPLPPPPPRWPPWLKPRSALLMIVANICAVAWNAYFAYQDAVHSSALLWIMCLSLSAALISSGRTAYLIFDSLRTWRRVRMQYECMVTLHAMIHKEMQMKEQTWTFRDRKGWTSGPWDNEPDKVQWTDPDTGLPCMIQRNHFGAWCGYVGISREYPDYGKDFGQVEVSIHGGLTFADTCDPNFDPETGQGICHVPEPGEPDDVWWLGFDCGHAFDYSPGLDATLRELGSSSENLDAIYCQSQTYRDIDYARAECRLLAIQLFSQQYSL